jgi:hypothetical protein
VLLQQSLLGEEAAVERPHGFLVAGPARRGLARLRRHAVRANVSRAAQKLQGQRVVDALVAGEREQALAHVHLGDERPTLQARRQDPAGGRTDQRHDEQG